MLIFVGIAAFVLWFVVQWVILFGATFPRGMWDVVAGYVRWYTRVNAYALGLVDRYPPFTLNPSITAAHAGRGRVAGRTTACAGGRLLAGGAPRRRRRPEHRRSSRRAPERPQEPPAPQPPHRP